MDPGHTGTLSTIGPQAFAQTEPTLLRVLKAGRLPRRRAARRQASGAPAPSTVSELQALQAQREAIDADHIQQLQAAFGPARFGYLDIYVRATTTVQPINCSRLARQRPFKIGGQNEAVASSCPRGQPQPFFLAAPPARGQEFAYGLIHTYGLTTMEWI